MAHAATEELELKALHEPFLSSNQGSRIPAATLPPRSDQWPSQLRKYDW
jgi:hypothetical protein